jgi:hypothetical protein
VPVEAPAPLARMWPEQAARGRTSAREAKVPGRIMVMVLGGRGRYERRERGSVEVLRPIRETA